MLKIKFNTNEFTIIFFEKIGKKINAKKFSIPTLSFFQLQCCTFLPFSVSTFSGLCLSLFLLQRPFLLFLPFSSVRHLFSFSAFFPFLQRLLFFSLACCPFFFSPKTFFPAQNVFAPAQNLFSVLPFCSTHTPVSASFCFVSALAFLFSLAPLFSSVRASSVSCQLPRPKNILSRCFTFLLFEYIFIFFKFGIKFK